MSEYDIIFTKAAQKDLVAITDNRVRGRITDRIMRLTQNPVEQADRVLSGDLHGFYSIRVAKARYRVVYRVISTPATVSIEVVGIRAKGDRKDAYETARKRLS